MSQDDAAEGNGWKSKALLAVLGVALVGSLGYQYFTSSDDGGRVPSRTVRDFVVTWQCQGCGEKKDTNAGRGPIKCPKCGKDEMYATITWACPTHGAKPVYFQYTEEGKPEQIRFGSGPWTPALTEEGGWNVLCPECKKNMMPTEAARPAG